MKTCSRVLTSSQGCRGTWSSGSDLCILTGPECVCASMCVCSHQVCVQVHPQAVQLLSGLRPVLGAVQRLLQPRDEPVQLLHEALRTREAERETERERDFIETVILT